MKERKCASCGKPFVPREHDERHCSWDCSESAEASRQGAAARERAARRDNS